MPTKAELTEELARLRQRVEEVESLETERAKAEDALRESEERLRDFAAAASDWFWEMDAELRVCYLSERLREVTGVDPDEVIGKSRLELGAGDTDSEKWEAHLAYLNARRPFRDFRYVYIAADGGRQYWSISGVPLFEEDGLFLGYRGTGRNLTDEYHARRMAFEAQDLLLQAVESFTAAVALFDADDRLLLFNQSYLDFHRYSSETIGPGMPFEELLRTQIKHGLIPAAFGREEDWLAERMERHRNPGEEFEVERSDGSWLRVREEQPTRDLPDLQRLGQWLLNHVPAQGPVGIVHGDYHLDNTLCHRERPDLLAVIDWEMGTIGDPLSDLGLLLMFWGPRKVMPPGFAHVQAVSRREAVVGRQALASAWSAASGLAADNLEFYLCFAFWRLAAIVEGAYGLYLSGKVDTPYARGLEYDVPALLQEAALAAEGDW